MPDSNDPQLESRAYTWAVRSLYLALIAAELWLVFDWYRETPSGAAALERLRQRIEAAKAKAADCEGCARRKARLQAAINRMQWQAERIVEGEDVPTNPDQPQ